MGSYTDSASSLPPGSVILAKALQESFVYDQYDRVMKEDEEALHPSQTPTHRLLDEGQDSCKS